MTLKKFRILRSVNTDGASGAGHTYEHICVESKFHATVIRVTWDGKLDKIKDVKPCDCVDHEIFPELALALDTYQRRHPT